MILIVSIACIGTFEAVLFWNAIQPPVGCGSCTVFGCTVTPGCIPEFMLVTESYKVSSPTLVTATIRNIGRGKGSLVSYYIKDSAGNSFHDPTWTGPTMDSNTVQSLGFVIDGKSFTFQLGNSYNVLMIDSKNGQYGFSIIPGVPLESSIRNTSLNATLNLVNHGPQTTTFTAYSVKDPQGHWYNSTNWTGPTLNPGDHVAVNILIDGQALVFQVGYWYTIEATDSTNTVHTWYVPFQN